ncbi:hypothetical protein J6590_022406 [Homalodisca vitripennis]|nr:hypothetical protein J6590_022406 [Homalodisca vitripennis]
MEASVTSEPQGILKRKTSSSTGPVHVTIAESVILAVAGEDSLADDHVRPILKKKTSLCEEPPGLSQDAGQGTEAPRPILKKKSSSETEDGEEKPMKPILKSRRDSGRVSEGRNSFTDHETQEGRADERPLQNGIESRDESLSAFSARAESSSPERSVVVRRLGKSYDADSLPKRRSFDSWVRFKDDQGQESHSRTSLSVAERVMNMENFLASEVQRPRSLSPTQIKGALPRRRDKERCRTQPITIQELSNSRRPGRLLPLLECQVVAGRHLTPIIAGGSIKPMETRVKGKSARRPVVESSAKSYSWPLVAQQNWVSPSLVQCDTRRYEHGVTVFCGLLLSGSCSQQQFLGVFRLQKKAVRILCGLNYRELCRDIFTELGLLTLPCLYILEVVLYCISRCTLVQGREVHNYGTRGKDILRLQQTELFLLRTFPNKLAWSKEEWAAQAAERSPRMEQEEPHALTRSDSVSARASLFEAHLKQIEDEAKSKRVLRVVAERYCMAKYVLMVNYEALIARTHCPSGMSHSVNIVRGRGCMHFTVP